MIASHPIDVAGHFVGVAISEAGLWRFRAIDPAVSALEGSRFPSFADTVRAAHQARIEPGLPKASPPDAPAAHRRQQDAPRHARPRTGR
ncbi:hypothetical protein M0638_21715 [Roseomonas sp. NAR14]|uniref:Uncharacterized protein n=1 Tax=Roseomonas acroporae TaxID=2937791 RepID=A0A9X1YDH0_9PROT|nr:hypothetical protein [Roseomonas acroporae]MCK8786995.1 hypothetical protein [Roseomonas acroporae]